MVTWAVAFETSWQYSRILCFKQTEAEYGTTESIVLESFLEDLVMCIPLTPHADDAFHLQFGAPNTGFNRIKEGALKTVVMLRLHTQGTWFNGAGSGIGRWYFFRDPMVMLMEQSGLTATQPACPDNHGPMSISIHIVIILVSSWSLLEPRVTPGCETTKQWRWLQTVRESGHLLKTRI